MTTRDDERPDPDELLRRYGSAIPLDDRGTLHIYLGAAPGVGKTYAMLLEGQRLREEGADVAVGLVETHNRPETAQLLHGLEQIPLRSIPYHGIELKELDVGAILARRPQIVLVDELAHTNAPGSAREKRWQDVELIRGAGIDVLTTLNIQHLESLNALIENITGVRVRETIPDHILDTATEIQLIDLPVGTLIERLRTGKIYPEARAQQALENFFREGNLTALRELALRETAAGVDDRLEDYMREYEVETVWAASPRVLAMLTGDEGEQSVIRSAWKLAEGERAELIVAAVVPVGGIDRQPPAQQQSWRLLLELAEDLGGRVETLESADHVSAICELLRKVNGSTVVIGYRPPRRRFDRIRSSLVDDLFDRLDGVEVHLVELGSRSINDRSGR